MLLLRADVLGGGKTGLLTGGWSRVLPYF
jgi:hypothetical protein